MSSQLTARIAEWDPERIFGRIRNGRANSEHTGGGRTRLDVELGRAWCRRRAAYARPRGACFGPRCAVGWRRPTSCAVGPTSWAPTSPRLSAARAPRGDPWLGETCFRQVLTVEGRKSERQRRRRRKSSRRMTSS